jgi:hypothetical protein
MSEKFERENKYLVIKWADMRKYLNERQLQNLQEIIAKVGIGRAQDDKDDHIYVVVNQDEPYAEDVWKLIEKHWRPRPEVEKR